MRDFYGQCLDLPGEDFPPETPGTPKDVPVQQCSAGDRIAGYWARGVTKPW